MTASAIATRGLLQHRPFVLFWLAHVCTTAGYQMMALVIASCSLLIADTCMLLFPDLRRIDRFEPADKEPTET